MSAVAVTLGGVAFQGFEVPQRIEIAGGQRLAVHQLIGGGRVVDALGEDDGKIEFSGVFSGSDAAIRAQLLDAATASGLQLPLYWASFFYTVVIQDFKVNYEKPWWIPFSLSCVVVIDPVAILTGLVSSIGNLISADIASALSFAPQAGLSLGLPATPDAGELANAQSVSAEAFAAGNASFSIAAATLDSAQNAMTGVGAVMGLAASSGQIAALANVNSYFGRASINMANQFL